MPRPALPTPSLRSSCITNGLAWAARWTPALPLLLAACSSGLPQAPGRTPPALAVADAARRCDALARLALPGLHQPSPQWVPAGQLRAVDPRTGAAVGEPLSAHCLLRARLDDRIGSDGERYHIGLEMRLPEQGNGRLLQQGGEGTEGQLPMAVGPNTGADGWADNALLRGFATVSTDGGHQSPGVSFGLDEQARLDHAGHAHWRVATTARALFEQWYGAPPQRSYFIGCGSGGRQGMMFTQRHPELFDGVIAQAPVMRAGQGDTIAAAWTVQKLLQVAPRGADGHPLLAQALSPAQVQRVAQEVLDRCDAADGLVDGLVADTALCRIDPRRLVCPQAGPACLRDDQAQALAELMAGPATREGLRLLPGWPWDPGLAHPGWRAWTLGSTDGGAAEARHLTSTSPALGYVFAWPPDPTLTLDNFDFERDPLRLAAAQRDFGTADEVRLDAYRQRAGKLMLVHGMADPVVSALQTVDYQRRVNAALGEAAASRAVRTFLVPGMNHCSGGPATDRFDGLSALVDWVEQGRAPDQLRAAGSTAMPGLERPLCAWPRIARYQGGDPRRADSFACR